MTGDGAILYTKDIDNWKTISNFQLQNAIFAAGPYVFGIGMLNYNVRSMQLLLLQSISTFLFPLMVVLIGSKHVWTNFLAIVTFVAYSCIGMR